MLPYEGDVTKVKRRQQATALRGHLILHSLCSCHLLPLEKARIEALPKEKAWMGGNEGERAITDRPYKPLQAPTRKREIAGEKKRKIFI